MKVAANGRRARVFREDDTFVPLGDAVVTVGRFDGVHRGHQALLATTRQTAAQRIGDRALAVTLWPPPEWILRPSEPRGLLTTLEDRITLLAASGVDDIVVLRFDREFSQCTATDFLRDLIDRFQMRTLVTGPSAAIGRDREGTPDVIADLAPRLGFDHVPVRYEGEPGTVSSSNARIALAAGDIDGLSAVLGRPHSVYGIVGRGDARGRELGFPTANLQLPAWLTLPADGVYAGSAVLDGDSKLYPALISVGTRPTFGSGGRLFESHLLGFNDEMYGHGLRTFLRMWLRPQERFDSVDDLIAAMRRDREAAESMALGDAHAAVPFLLDSS